jgi:hypothetical protein
MESTPPLHAPDPKPPYCVVEDDSKPPFSDLVRPPTPAARMFLTRQPRNCARRCLIPPGDGPRYVQLLAPDSAPAAEVVLLHLPPTQHPAPSLNPTTSAAPAVPAVHTVSR